MAMGRHHDQVDVLVASRLHDFVGRVASEQHACDRNPIELRPQRLIQIFLSPLDDVRVQIPRGDLVPALQHAGGIAERRHHVQQDYLRMKAARQPSGLMNDVPGSIREHNRNKNFLNVQHHSHLSSVEYLVTKLTLMLVIARLNVSSAHFLVHCSPAPLIIQRALPLPPQNEVQPWKPY